ncbi:Tyrosine-protein kinase [Balamuthia mandrillaris]
MLRQQLQTTSTLSASRTSKPTLSFNKQTKSFNLASRATTPTCSAQVLDNLVQIPADSTKAEWFKVNTVNFYNMLAMLYGNMEYKCTSQSCPKMMAGAKYEYFWAEGEHARRPVSLPAPEYIKRLFDWAQELVEDESLFPLDDSPPGSGFDEACNKLFRRLPRIIMHLFYHHYHTMLAEGFGEHAVSILKHMVMFSMEHKLTSIDYYAPVQDILVQTLPPSYAQQFQSPSQTIVKPQQAQPQLQQPPVQTVQQHHPQRQPPSGSIFQTIRLTDELTPFSPASTRTTTITSVSSSGASPPAGKYSSSTTSYIDTEQKTMAKFVGLLEQVGLDEERARWYAKTLVENDIDESVFDSLTDETLKELGVSSIGHRLKIMKIKPLLQATEKGEPERENNFIRHDKKMKDKENEERLTEEQEKEKGPETEKENEKEEFVPTIQETELSFVQLIGRGNFGEVWKGTWRGTTSVAIKKLHTHLCDERSKKEFLAESELLMNIKPHPHLILPLGTCIRSAGSSGETDFLLVTEFIEDGSLDKFITAHKFDHYEKLNIAKGIAAGNDCS